MKIAGPLNSVEFGDSPDNYNIQDELNAINEDTPGWWKMTKPVMSKILNESYEGHQEGCLHCAEINELASHARKHFKPINLEEKEDE